MKPARTRTFSHTSTHICIHTATHMFAHAHLCAHACTCTHLHKHICTHLYAHTFACTQLHIICMHMHICTHICMHTHSYACVHLYAHTHFFTYTFVYTYIHLHTCICHAHIMNMYLHTHTFVRMHILMHTYISMHIRTLAHTHLHTVTHHLFAHAHSHTHLHARTFAHTLIYTSGMSFSAQWLDCRPRCPPTWRPDPRAAPQMAQLSRGSRGADTHMGACQNAPLAGSFPRGQGQVCSLHVAPHYCFGAWGCAHALSAQRAEGWLSREEKGSVWPGWGWNRLGRRALWARPTGLAVLGSVAASFPPAAWLVHECEHTSIPARVRKAVLRATPPIMCC